MIVESVCSTELQLVLGNSVTRECPFEHRLQCQGGFIQYVRRYEGYTIRGYSRQLD